MNTVQPLSHEDVQYASMALDYYHTCLKSNDQAIDYLVNQRGISEEAIDAFGLGFADRTLCTQLGQDKSNQEAIRGALQRFGLIATRGASNGREVLRGSIAFPVIDEFGCLNNAFGRKIGHKLRRTSEAYVVNENGSCLFNGGIVFTYKQRIGIKKPKPCMLFRHTCATAMINNCAGLMHVQELLGHEDISTTQAYVHLAINDLKDDFQRTHPSAKR